MPVSILDLPPDFDRVTLHGRWVLLSGTPSAGTVTLQPSVARLVSPAHSTVIMGTPVNIALDDQGAMAAEVPATDDPDIAGGPWAYTVTVTIQGASSYSFSLQVPHDGAPIDLSALTPPLVPPPIPDAPIVWSVNGSVGHVSLGAADVGALAVDLLGAPEGVAGLDAAGVVPAAQLPDVVGEPGQDGADGASAYALAVADGFEGTLAEWLGSLVGPEGKDGLPGQDGSDGEPGLPGADGSDGASGTSAYEVAVANGYAGTVEEWLASLAGLPGENGADGEQGQPGTDGQDGADGAPGTPGDTSWTWSAPHAGATPPGAALHRMYNTTGSARTVTRVHASVASTSSSAIAVEVRRAAAVVGTVTIPANTNAGSATLAATVSDGEYLTVAVLQGDAVAEALTVTVRVG